MRKCWFTCACRPMSSDVCENSSNTTPPNWERNGRVRLKIATAIGDRSLEFTAANLNLFQGCMPPLDSDLQVLLILESITRGLFPEKKGLMPPAHFSMQVSAFSMMQTTSNEFKNSMCKRSLHKLVEIQSLRLFSTYHPEGTKHAIPIS